MIDLDQTRGHQSSLHRRAQVGSNFDTLAYPPVQVEHRFAVLAVANYSAMDVTHVRFAVQGRAT